MPAASVILHILNVILPRLTNFNFDIGQALLSTVGRGEPVEVGHQVSRFIHSLRQALGIY